MEKGTLEIPLALMSSYALHVFTGAWAHGHIHWKKEKRKQLTNRNDFQLTVLYFQGIAKYSILLKEQCYYLMSIEILK